MPDFDVYARVGAALAAVLALAWLAARIARRTPLAAAAGRRLRITESIPLDSRRRLILASCDGREILLLIGGAADLQLRSPSPPEPPCEPSR